MTIPNLSDDNIHSVYQTHNPYQLSNEGDKNVIAGRETRESREIRERRESQARESSERVKRERQERDERIERKT